MRERYSVTNPGHLFIQQHVERALLRDLSKAGVVELASADWLDVGCGDGSWLRRFSAWGVPAERLHGVDALEDRVRTSRGLAPHIDVAHADASALPFSDASFDIVCQFMMFSSIVDDDVRRAAAVEMARVLRPSGIIVSYDFVYARDRRSTVPIRGADLMRLFPGFDVTVRRVTLLPPIARFVAPRSRLACELLATLPFLHGHELALLRRESTDR
jgi:ubiquinone/menaquinone biosynthesis C-methylase UbiE